MTKKLEETIKQLMEYDSSGWAAIAGSSTVKKKANTEPVVSDPGGWKGFANSAPEIAKSGREASGALLPGYSAAEKAAQGDFKGAAQDAAIDAVVVGTGGILGKIGSKFFKRTPKPTSTGSSVVKSTIGGTVAGAAVGSVLGGSGAGPLFNYMPRRPAMAQSVHPPVKTSVASSSARIRPKKSRRVVTREETEEHKRNKKAQQKYKIIDEAYLKNQMIDVLNRAAHDASFFTPPEPKPAKKINKTQIITNPKVKEPKP